MLQSDGLELPAELVHLVLGDGQVLLVVLIDPSVSQSYLLEIEIIFRYRKSPKKFRNRKNISISKFIFRLSKNLGVELIQAIPFCLHCMQVLEMFVLANTKGKLTVNTVTTSL